VLDRPINFNEAELNFGNYQPPRSVYLNQPAPAQSGSSVPNPRGRFPF